LHDARRDRLKEGPSSSWLGAFVYLHPAEESSRSGGENEEVRLPDKPVWAGILPIGVSL